MPFQYTLSNYLRLVSNLEWLLSTQKTYKLHIRAYIYIYACSLYTQLHLVSSHSFNPSSTLTFSLNTNLDSWLICHNPITFRPCSCINQLSPQHNSYSTSLKHDTHTAFHYDKTKHRTLHVSIRVICSQDSLPSFTLAECILQTQMPLLILHSLAPVELFHQLYSHNL